MTAVSRTHVGLARVGFALGFALGFAGVCCIPGAPRGNCSLVLASGGLARARLLRMAWDFAGSLLGGGIFRRAAHSHVALTWNKLLVGA